MDNVKDGNYINIQAFMIRDLKLKGNELLVYAVIYGFSQDGKNVFNGSLQYLADWTNSTKRAVINVLKNLVDKGLIEKIDTGKQTFSYKTVEKNSLVKKVHYGKKFTSTGEKNSPDYRKKFTGTSEKNSPNNIDIINNNINNNLVCSTHDAHEEKEVEIETQPILVDYQKKKKEKEELKAKIDEYKTLVSKATGEEKAKIDLVLKPYVYIPHLDQLLEKIKASKFLLGEKEQKPSLRIFAYKTNEIIAGIYDDFEKKQTAETKKTKTRNFNPDNPYDTRTPEQIEKDRREQEEFERAIGIL